MPENHKSFSTKKREKLSARSPNHCCADDCAGVFPRNSSVSLLAHRVRVVVISVSHSFRAAEFMKNLKPSLPINQAWQPPVDYLHKGWRGLGGKMNWDFGLTPGRGIYCWQMTEPFCADIVAGMLEIAEEVGFFSWFRLRKNILFSKVSKMSSI